jgi:hypothetical protein
MARTAADCLALSMSWRGGLNRQTRCPGVVEGSGLRRRAGQPELQARVDRWCRRSECEFPADSRPYVGKY